MINFIKDAVTAVSGIKSFLFNTDYRNNFDLQNVEFPCCVLTPIMNKKYDLKNIIRESAELQLSVVETAPYEYTGDELYAINKRCSDLALQVIANLQVKSKLDKELTFEFILPSGDELISGVMCNLTATMKQGSCIGAPSYVEIVVQPIKKESITSNGKHVISPSKGFTAMKEVEVDVDVPVPTTEYKSVTITSNGEVEILPTSADAMTKVTAKVQVPPPPLEEKQVTITRNGVTEIVPTSEYGLSRVEVVAEVAPNLQDKQVTITENGTTTITADEGFEGLSSVEVNVEVNANVASPFSSIGWDDNDNDMYNDKLLQDIAYSKTLYDTWSTSKTSAYRLYLNDKNIIYAPKIDTSKVTNMNGMFSGCTSLTTIPLLNTSKVTDMSNMFNYCDTLTSIPQLDTSEVILMNNMFNTCKSLTTIPLLNTSKVTNMNGMFSYCDTLTSIPQLDTSEVTNMSYMFASCYELKTLPLLDASKVTTMINMLSSCNKLVNLGGFLNCKVALTIPTANNLNKWSLINVINNLYDLTANGLSGQTLTIGSTNLKKLTADEIAVATKKGWTVK